MERDSLGEKVGNRKVAVDPLREAYPGTNAVSLGGNCSGRISEKAKSSMTQFGGSPRLVSVLKTVERFSVLEISLLTLTVQLRFSPMSTSINSDAFCEDEPPEPAPPPPPLLLPGGEGEGGAWYLKVR